MSVFPPPVTSDPSVPPKRGPGADEADRVYVGTGRAELHRHGERLHVERINGEPHETGNVGIGLRGGGDSKGSRVSALNGGDNRDGVRRDV